MNCRNEFCIYQKDDKCILDEINLDIQGSCEECIYVEINNKVLQVAKDKKLY
mgnify:CR=1 FL=1